jgi:PqqD family protein of HPr-rel-A system
VGDGVGVRWRLCAPEAITWREWPDGIVVYNDATGHTHHLSPLCGEVLLILLQAADGADASSLTDLIAARLDASGDARLSVEIQRVLEELGQIEIATSTS